MPSDAQRIHRVKLLIENGYGHRVFIAQDIHSKHRLVSVQMIVVWPNDAIVHCPHTLSPYE